MRRKDKSKKRSEKPAAIAEQVVHVLSLPSDCVLGNILLSAIGNHTLYVENYSKILCYEDDCIQIEARHGMISLIGKQLNIEYFGTDEMKITGRIQQINF